MRRYRSYKLYDRSRRPTRACRRTKARQRLEWENNVQHFMFAFRVCMSLGFLFCLRIAIADVQDGELLGGVGFGGLATMCLMTALFLRAEPSIRRHEDDD